MNFDNLLNIRVKDKIEVLVDNDDISFYKNNKKIYSDHPQSLLCDLLESYGFKVKMA